MMLVTVATWIISGLSGSAASSLFPTFQPCVEDSDLILENRLKRTSEAGSDLVIER